MNSLSASGKHVCRSILAVCLVGLMTACAITPSDPGTAVRQRAQERWDLLLGGQHEQAYAYFSPGFRSSISLTAWQRKLLTQPVQWRAARVLDSTCEADSCKVAVEVDIAVHGAVPGVKVFNASSKFDEDWVLVEGDWFLVPKQ